jgi:hypothetical protein
MIREVIRTRVMPPWDADPAHGRFANSCDITVEQQRMIVHWIENGAAASASDPLARKRAKAEPEWPLGKPDLIVSLPEQQVPATGTLPKRKASISYSFKTN